MHLVSRTDVERGLDTAAQKDFGLVGSTPACKELGEEPRVIVTKDGMAWFAPTAAAGAVPRWSARPIEATGVECATGNTFRPCPASCSVRHNEAA
jgi:hypothetical protein